MAPLKVALTIAGLVACDGFSLGAVPVRVPTVRAAATVVMDETIIQKALAGELEEEGAENIFLSEVGWADYLDKNAQSSYSMNERPSLAADGYYTASMLDNPLDVLGDWFNGLKGYISAPVATAFPTITNDIAGTRSYPKGLNEISARTIKPKEKDISEKSRIRGIPGFNAFGTPSSKQTGNILDSLPFNKDKE